MSDCNDGAPKSNDGGVCEVNNILHNTKIEDDNGMTNICANCGKEGSDVTNICNKCNSVMYCNAACKKKHRSKHKKECERRVAELHDEELFKQPPSPYGDCPICFLLMPSLETGRTYQVCCGKAICSGCWFANAHIDVNKQLCPLCRTPAPNTDEEILERTNKRVEAGDPTAILTLGNYHDQGLYGLQQNYTKALELWHRAAEFGNIRAYFNIGVAYYTGNGVKMDKKKGDQYFVLAAMEGNAMARNNLGCLEWNAGNIDRAMKHWMIAVGSGYNNSLKKIQQLYSNGHVTKDDYAKALQAYQAYLGEIRSDQRDKAAAEDEDEDCNYY